MRIVLVSVATILSFSGVALGQEYAPAYRYAPNHSLAIKDGSLRGYIVVQNESVKPPSERNARSTKPPIEIKKISEPVSPKQNWASEGQASPQKTLETFLWALREQDAESIRDCCIEPDKAVGDSPSGRFTKLSRVIDAYQPLAIRIHDSQTVDLKFCLAIQEKGKILLSHRLLLVDDKWRLDLSSSTQEANW